MRLFAILLFLGVFTSCDTETCNDLPESSIDYFPLTIGDKWEYRDHTREVTGIETINGIEYKLVEIKTYRADTLYSTHQTYFRLESGGKVYKVNNNKTGEFLFVNFSLTEGESWEYDSHLGNGDKWNVLVRPEVTFDFGNQKLDNCKPFFYDVPGWADEEQVYIFAKGIGEINNYSPAWGGSDTLQQAVINSIEFNFK